MTTITKPVAGLKTAEPAQTVRSTDQKKENKMATNANPETLTFDTPHNLIKFPDGSLIEFTQHDADTETPAINEHAAVIWEKMQALDTALKAAHAVMHEKGRG